MSEINQINILVLGNGSVGKSSIIIKYIDNKFSLNYLTTLGLDFKQKKMKLKNGKQISLKIFDTAGQERYKSVSISFIKKADGVLLIYDISNRSSFDAINDWIQNLMDVGKERIPVVLIGNKCDLPEDKREVSNEEGIQKSNEYKIPFFETSCKDGININEVFDKIVEEITCGGGWSSSSNSKILNKKGEKKKCC